MLFAATLSVFVWHFCDPNIDATPVDFDADRAPDIGSDASALTGVVIFNFAVVLALPDVISAASPRADLKRSVRYSCVFMVVAYLVVGFTGSLAYPSAGPIPSVIVSSRAAFVFVYRDEDQHAQHALDAQIIVTMSSAITSSQKHLCFMTLDCDELNAKPFLHTK